MNNNSQGFRLKAARKKLRLSQVALSKLTGISQARLSQLERGERRVAAPEIPVLLARLGVNFEKTPPRVVLPAADRAWRIARPTLELCSTRPTEARKNAALRSFGARVERALARVQRRPDAEFCQEYLRQSGLDSGHEYLFWVELLAADAKPCLMAPATVGFRSLRIADPANWATVNDVPCPCLEIDIAGYPCLLFPQLTLDTRKAYFRLDATLCVRDGRDRVWMNIEVDGAGHDGEFDAERARLLGMSTIRLDRQALLGEDLVTTLGRRIRTLLYPAAG